MNRSATGALFGGMDQILEITFTLVLLYLVLSRANGFSSIVKTFSSAYIGAVKALQGR